MPTTLGHALRFALFGVLAGCASAPTRVPAPLAVERLARIGGPGVDFAHALAVSPDGGIVVGIETAGSPGFDGRAVQAISASAEEMAVLAAYDRRGHLTWAEGLGGPGAHPAVRAVASGTDGSIFGAGWFSGRFGLLAPNGGPSVESDGGSDAFVAALGADGHLRWLRRFGGKYADTARALLPAPEGGVYVAGSFRLNARFGEQEDGSARVLVSHGGSDAFLLRLGADGQVRWAISVGGAEDDETLALAAAPDGGGYLLASYRGRLALDIAGSRREFVARGANDALLLRFSADGRVIAACSIGSEAPDDFITLAADAEGIAVGGYFSGSRELTIGERALHLASRGASDALLLRLDANLALRDHVQISGTGATTLERLAYGQDGRLWAAGSFNGRLPLGHRELVAEGGDAWFAVFDRGLDVDDALAFSGRGTQQVLAIAPDTRGGAFVAGAFSKELAVRGQPTAPIARGRSDAFVAHVIADAALAARQPKRAPAAEVESDDD
ncbi:hypothetical protein [Dokdonella soli]|uniref:Delta-60 repeat domain-containing protein n=1 Tax=Dokdonella soli TaxID=529810 RepID=A0ABN1IH17_9GAMM